MEVFDWFDTWKIVNEEYRVAALEVMGEWQCER